MGPFYVALIHYPVYNRKGQVVATAITNLDIHDIARAARTFGAQGVLVVNPLDRQKWLLRRILHHWKRGYGATTHPNRRDALDHVHAVDSLEEAVDWIVRRHGRAPVLVATTARPTVLSIGYEELRQAIEGHIAPVLLLLGTGWGLTDEVISSSHYVLKPIMEGAPYNHLSVRSAAAVILDRLLGDRSEGPKLTEKGGAKDVAYGEDREGTDESGYPGLPTGRHRKGACEDQGGGEGEDTGL